MRLHERIAPWPFRDHKLLLWLEKSTELGPEPEDVSERIVYGERHGRAQRLEGFDPIDDEIERVALLRQADRFSDLRSAPLDTLEAQLGPIADGRLAAKGVMEIDRDSRWLLLSNLAQALANGFQTRAKRLGGDFSTDETAQRYPEWQQSSKSATQATSRPQNANGSLSLAGIVDQWWIEAKAAGRSESTKESYSNSFRLLSSFLGHDDAARVTPEDIIRFKDHRLTTPNPKTGKPVSAKTVKASDLTAFKSVFDWAVANRKLASNPATSVTVKLGKRVKVRERDFTDAEATAILTAASALASKKPLSQTDAMKRWVPWLCAYTGSRVGEMVQLRKEDIRQEDGSWIITITPEAGTVKGKERRDVPVHKHLIDMGFIDFVKGSGSGYLFMTIKPDKTFHGTWQSKKNRLAEFARTVVKDPNVAPNHGWRHTFKTRVSRQAFRRRCLMRSVAMLRRL